MRSRPSLFRLRINIPPLPRAWPFVGEQPEGGRPLTNARETFFVPQQLTPHAPAPSLFTMGDKPPDEDASKSRVGTGTNVAAAPFVPPPSLLPLPSTLGGSRSNGGGTAIIAGSDTLEATGDGARKLVVLQMPRYNTVFTRFSFSFFFVLFSLHTHYPLRIAYLGLGESLHHPPTTMHLSDRHMP